MPLAEVDEDWEEWNPTKGKFTDHMIAGSIAGMVEHVSIFPFDTIKTHMQCQKCPINNTVQRMSALDTASALVKSDGPLRLWRGVSAMFGASIPAHAAYFSLFEFLKYTFDADGPEHTPLASGAAGVGATVAHDLIMTPMDVVKQRLQLGYYTGTFDCLRRVIHHEGVRALYMSFPTTLLMNVPYGMVMVASNETIKRVLNPSGEHNAQAYFVSGALSGALAAAVTNPLDVAKTRLQTQMVETCPRAQEGVVLEMAGTCTVLKTEPHLRVQYRGLVDTLSQIRAQDGTAGLFRGIGPRLLVHTPSVAISWTTYEIVKEILTKIE